MLTSTLLFTFFPYTTLFRSILVIIESYSIFLIRRFDEIWLNLLPFLMRVCFDRIFANGVFVFLFQLVTGKSRSEEHTSELQSRGHLVCRLLLEKKNNISSCA